ncbi:hypothetical protein CWO89_14260 [Bradyrhizobium sp. Leo170]|nr:hypothetical protein CWO89_14260 [Bradyrhizobium sp. Leo170]
MMNTMGAAVNTRQSRSRPVDRRPEGTLIKIDTGPPWGKAAVEVGAQMSALVQTADVVRAGARFSSGPQADSQ